MEHYPFVCGVPNLVKAAHTPRHTAETRTRHTHLSKAIEANIEQGQPPLTITKFQKCVKFGVHFSKQVTMLYRFGVGLQLIGADGFNPTLIQYHRNVLLGTRNLQAQGIRNPQQPMNLFRVHKNALRDISPARRKGVQITSCRECKTYSLQDRSRCGQCLPTPNQYASLHRAQSPIDPHPHGGGSHPRSCSENRSLR